jgi:hypothetical protein
MKNYKTLLASLLFCFIPSAFAQLPFVSDEDRCSNATVQSVGKHFELDYFAYPDTSETKSGRIKAGVCKTWPVNQSRMIAAFAYDDGTQDEKKLYVAVLDSKKNQVVASYVGVIMEDAATVVLSDSLMIDTARYALSKDTRAFGVRLNNFKDRCTYEGGFNDELTLFVVKDKEISPVLKETMSHWIYDDGNRCSGDEVGRTDAIIKVSIEQTRSNGFADIKLTAKRNDNKKSISTILKYNGESYETKHWNTAFNAWFN